MPELRKQYTTSEFAGLIRQSQGYDYSAISDDKLVAQLISQNPKYKGYISNDEVDRLSNLFPIKQRPKTYGEMLYEELGSSAAPGFFGQFKHQSKSMLSQIPSAVLGGLSWATKSIMPETSEYLIDKSESVRKHFQQSLISDIVSDPELQALYAWKKDEPATINNFWHLDMTKRFLANAGPSIVGMAALTFGTYGVGAALKVGPTALKWSGRIAGLTGAASLEGSALWNEAMEYLTTEEGLSNEQARDEAIGPVAVATPLIAAMEYLPFARVLNKSGLGKLSRTQMMKQVTKRFRGNALARMSKASSQQALFEGVTEHMQEMTGALAAHAYMSGYGNTYEEAFDNFAQVISGNWTSPEARESFFSGTAAGFVMGPLSGGPSRAASSLAKKYDKFKGQLNAEVQAGLITSENANYLLKESKKIFYKTAMEGMESEDARIWLDDFESYIGAGEISLDVTDTVTKEGLTEVSELDVTVDKSPKADDMTTSYKYLTALANPDTIDDFYAEKIEDEDEIGKIVAMDRKLKGNIGMKILSLIKNVEDSVGMVDIISGHNNASILIDMAIDTINEGSKNQVPTGLSMKDKILVLKSFAKRGSLIKPGEISGLQDEDVDLVVSFDPAEEMESTEEMETTEGMETTEEIPDDRKMTPEEQQSFNKQIVIDAPVAPVKSDTKQEIDKRNLDIGKTATVIQKGNRLTGKQVVIKGSSKFGYKVEDADGKTWSFYPSELNIEGKKTVKDKKKYDGLTNAELKKELKKRGITKYSNLKKSELVARLEDNDSKTPTTEEVFAAEATETADATETAETVQDEITIDEETTDETPSKTEFKKVLSKIITEPKSKEAPVEDSSEILESQDELFISAREKIEKGLPLTEAEQAIADEISKAEQAPSEKAPTSATPTIEDVVSDESTIEASDKESKDVTIDDSFDNLQEEGVSEQDLIRDNKEVAYRLEKRLKNHFGSLITSKKIEGLIHRHGKTAVGMAIDNLAIWSVTDGRLDTIPHEFAHIYIEMMAGTDIVKAGIKKFGSEEALVQYIGEYYANRIQDKNILNKIKIWLNQFVAKLKLKTGRIKVADLDDIGGFIAEEMYKGKWVGNKFEKTDGYAMFQVKDDINDEGIEDSSDPNNIPSFEFPSDVKASEFYSEVFNINISNHDYGSIFRPLMNEDQTFEQYMQTLIRKMDEYSKTRPDRKNYNKFTVDTIGARELSMLKLEWVKSTSKIERFVQDKNESGFTRKYLSYVIPWRRMGDKTYESSFVTVQGSKNLTTGGITNDNKNLITGNLNPQFENMSFFEQDFKDGKHIIENIILKVGDIVLRGQRKKDKRFWYKQASSRMTYQRLLKMQDVLISRFAQFWADGKNPDLIFLVSSKAANNKSAIYTGKLPGEATSMTIEEIKEYWSSEADVGNITTEQSNEIISRIDTSMNSLEKTLFDITKEEMQFGIEKAINSGKIKVDMTSSDTIKEGRDLRLKQKLIEQGKLKALVSTEIGRHEWWKAATIENYMTELTNLDDAMSRLTIHFGEGFTPRGAGVSKAMLIENDVEVYVKDAHGSLVRAGIVDDYDGESFTGTRWFKKIADILGAKSIFELKTLIRSRQVNDIDGRYTNLLGVKHMAMAPFNGMEFRKNGMLIAKLVGDYNDSYFVDPDGNHIDHIVPQNSAKQNHGLGSKNNFSQMYTVHELNDETDVRVIRLPGHSNSAAFPISLGEMILDTSKDSHHYIDLINALEEHYGDVAKQYLDMMFKFRRDPKALWEYVNKDMRVNEAPTEGQKYLKLIGPSGMGVHQKTVISSIMPMLNNRMIKEGIFKARNSKSGYGTHIYIKPQAGLVIDKGSVIASANNDVIFNQVLKSYMELNDISKVKEVWKSVDGSKKDMVVLLNEFLKDNIIRALLHRQPINKLTAVNMHRIQSLEYGQHGNVVFMRTEDVKEMLDADWDGDEVFIEFIPDRLANAISEFQSKIEDSNKSNNIDIFGPRHKDSDEVKSFITPEDVLKTISDISRNSGAVGMIKIASNVMYAIGYKNVKVFFKKDKSIHYEAFQPSDESVMDYIPLNIKQILKNDSEFVKEIIEEGGSIVKNVTDDNGKESWEEVPIEEIGNYTQDVQDVAVKADDVAIVHSGGAIGADTEFQIQAEAHGIEVKAHSFKGHAEDNEARVEHTEKELEEADEHLIKANETLGRKFPSNNPAVNRLLRRNYFQVKDSDQIIAVANIVDGKIKGGTAWAVQMGIDMGKQVHIFNMQDNFWYTWNGKRFSSSMGRDGQKGLPLLSREFAGIGDTNITEEGKAAIKSFFEQETADVSLPVYLRTTKSHEWNLLLQMAFDNPKYGLLNNMTIDANFLRLLIFRPFLNGKGITQGEANAYESEKGVNAANDLVMVLNSIKTLEDSSPSRHGRVNNSNKGSIGQMVEMSRDLFNRYFDTNFTGKINKLSDSEVSRNYTESIKDMLGQKFVDSIGDFSIELMSKPTPTEKLLMSIEKRFSSESINEEGTDISNLLSSNMVVSSDVFLEMAHVLALNEISTTMKPSKLAEVEAANRFLTEVEQTIDEDGTKMSLFDFFKSIYKKADEKSFAESKNPISPDYNADFIQLKDMWINKFNSLPEQVQIESTRRFLYGLGDDVYVQRLLPIDLMHKGFLKEYLLIFEKKLQGFKGHEKKQRTGDVKATFEGYKILNKLYNESTVELKKITNYDELIKICGG